LEANGFLILSAENPFLTQNWVGVAVNKIRYGEINRSLVCGSLWHPGSLVEPVLLLRGTRGRLWNIFSGNAYRLCNRPHLEILSA
jgi:hypothetical protein